MYKLQLRNTKNMEKQGKMIPPKAYNSLITELKDTETVKVSKTSKV
jgi:hypothetical protein